MRVKVSPCRFRNMFKFVTQICHNEIGNLFGLRVTSVIYRYTIDCKKLSFSVLSQKHMGAFESRVYKWIPNISAHRRSLTDAGEEREAMIIVANHSHICWTQWPIRGVKESAQKCSNVSGKWIFKISVPTGTKVGTFDDTTHLCRVTWLPVISKQIMILINIKTANSNTPSICQINDILFFFQYYEMSYGLNIEMHKQVSLLVPSANIFWFSNVMPIIPKQQSNVKVNTFKVIVLSKKKIVVIYCPSCWTFCWTQK